MGVGRVYSWPTLLLFVILPPAANAAPKLRLVSASVGPVSVAAGANGTAQVVEAYNAGDGALQLSAAPLSTWLTASVGSPRQCSNRPGQCIPINIGLQTAQLPRGIFTGSVQVNDPGALDAPQILTVTVQMGGGVPDQALLYVAPNGSTAAQGFTTNSELRSTINTQSGGPWLSLALEGAGSFRFSYPYRITARHLDGMPEGSYVGSIALSGSSFAGDNKTVPVNLQVTSRPIARPAPERLFFRVAQGAPSQQQFVAVSNGGLGTLSLSGATASVTGGGEWLSAEVVANATQVGVRVNVQGLNAGTYGGTVNITGNAVNTLAVPVQLDVVAAGPPLAAPGGVLNSGSFDEGLSPGGVAAVFGEQLSLEEQRTGTQIPLVTELGGVQVLVNDRPSPLYFSSYNQVNFQIPYETPVGEAVVRVVRGSVRGNPVSIQVQPRSPRIIRSGIGDYGVVVNRDGSLALPSGRPARRGEAITIYGVGFGPTSPGVTTGAAAPGQEPLARVLPAPHVVFGSAFNAIEADALYIGLTPSLVGLYQVNVIVPPEVAVGDVQMVIVGEGYASNRVLLPVQ